MGQAPLNFSSYNFYYILIFAFQNSRESPWHSVSFMPPPPNPRQWCTHHPHHPLSPPPHTHNRVRPLHYSHHDIKTGQREVERLDHVVGVSAEELEVGRDVAPHLGVVARIFLAQQNLVEKNTQKNIKLQHVVRR